MNPDSIQNWDTETQRKYWNDRDVLARLTNIDAEALRRGNEARWLLRSLHISKAIPGPRILEVGCGKGWLLKELVEYGQVTGIDISDVAIEEARRAVPKARFYAGDISSMDLRVLGHFDVIVCLETLAHVVDQPRFMELMNDLLNSNGYLILTTQNRSVYTRKSHVRPPGEGQFRHWVTQSRLRGLLLPHFEVQRMFTIEPSGDHGILRIARLFPKHIQEHWGCGQTIVSLSQKVRQHRLGPFSAIERLRLQGFRWWPRCR